MPDGHSARRKRPLAKWLFYLSLILLTYTFGLASARYRLPPYPAISNAIGQLKVAVSYDTARLPWQFFAYDRQPGEETVVHDRAAMAPGATMIAGFTADETVHRVAVIDSQNNVLQEWRLKWDDLWPGPTPHIPDQIMARPQKHTHGTLIAENGDLIVNFTELATFRVNPCGKVVWRLDRRGHHAVEPVGDGTFWIPGITTHYQPMPDFPAYAPPFEEPSAIHVSADGRVLQEFSISKLLVDNGFRGLMYLSTLDEMRPVVSGDTLHLNDIAVFPDSMPEGIAHHGDLLISLRNISTIILVDPATLKIRFATSGVVQRQHDVDFIDGNTISAFDNNVLLSDWLDNISGKRNNQGQSSSVATISLRTGRVTSRIASDGNGPFFSDLMGDHQWLANGNLLVAEARAGRAFEIAPDGHQVWEYYNVAEPGMLGDITNVIRLDPSMDAAFFAAARAACGG